MHVVYSYVCYSLFTLNPLRQIPHNFIQTGGDDASVSTREESMSPTSFSSVGATSLQHEGEHGDSSTGGSATASAATGQSVYESSCRQLLSVVDELAWYHSQIQVT